MLKTNTPLTNLHTDIFSVSDNIKELLKSVDETVFGLEMILSHKSIIKRIVAPPYIQFDKKGSADRQLKLHNMDFYEGYLSKPLFFPLDTNLYGEFVTNSEKLSLTLQKDEKVFVQWLFKRASNWENKALNMYSSYLKGNDQPLTFSIGILIQEKILHLINNIASFKGGKNYIEKAERKILDDGFQFQLRIGIKSNTSHTVLDEYKKILSEYNYYNGIFLNRLKGKNIFDDITNCRLTSGKMQLLGKEEITSLFCSDGIDVESTFTNTTCNSHSSIGQILPYLTRKKSEVPSDLVTNIAEALKRVGLISVAKIYNETITMGLRLIVIQFNIPKNKTITQLQNKQKDLQASLGIESLGVEQGELPDTVKLTLPNIKPSMISLQELINSPNFTKFKKDNPLAFIVGVDEANNPIYLSLIKLVHLLIAGTTGSGKSVFLNAIAITLMSSHTPEQLQIHMIDPKEVEMQQYENFPHVQEVVTDMEKALTVLEKLTKEMNKRYSAFREHKVKNIGAYNHKNKQVMPYKVCIIDEYADLKTLFPEVEDFIGRLGQKARAAGIHLIIATQRPDSKVISGRIKSVIPNAISFNLNNNINYKTVFGSGIPYSNLLGKGDGVMKIEGYSKEFQRFQSPIVSPNELEEEQVYKKLEKYFKGKYSDVGKELINPHGNNDNSNNLNIHLNRLKKIIANTRETRVTPLRDLIGVKMTTMVKLMNILVEEGWFIKHNSKAKGYELIAKNELLNKWRE